MGEKVTVRVTRDHIAHAIRQTSTQCAVAVALKDAGEGYTHPYVTKDKISFSDPATGLRYTFRVPPKVAELIEKFDALGPQTAKPAAFTLDFEEAVSVRPIIHLQPSVALEKAKNMRERKARGASNSNVYTSYREIRSTDV